eukprot:TRINITY_DN4729_c0_g1_i3.p1 TRINITY_DN4729_c0_g1~~TRINITY_DN4729_c0_g1_i3.p1  ORF type:complete len:125 (-),score=10.24 TRINITY_DN4729_c0_g1_i3:41-415(-)
MDFLTFLFLLDKEEKVWVADLDERPVGCVSIATQPQFTSPYLDYLTEEEKSHKIAELRRLVVDSSVQRMGVATQLVTQLEQHAREQGFKLVFLKTANTGAMKFYQKLGYTIVKQNFGYVMKKTL